VKINITFINLLTFYALYFQNRMGFLGAGNNYVVGMNGSVAVVDSLTIVF
jgi:hypothetical protein